MNRARRTHLFVTESIVPIPATSLSAKLFDIHILVFRIGRKRPTEEYVDELEATEWEHVDTRYPENDIIGAIDAVRP